ncbi:protein PIF-like [Littorina saxatilis]|uniref:protein PIF-like n=1 Tax=Littorina saxatilis TaxID=31220 RepID=UPI0038B4B9E1
MLLGFKSCLSALLVLVCLTHHHRAQDAECNSLDIVFVLDGSSSLVFPNWIRLRNILVTALGSLAIAPNQINVGFVVFSTTVTYTSPQLSGDKQQLLNIVRDLEYPDSGTYTNLAIDEAARLLRSSRPSDVAPDVMVIVTDGATDTATETTNSVAAAKAEGIAIFAIGIGPTIKISDLEALADSKRVINAGDINNLNKALNDITKQACAEVTTTTAAPMTTTTPAPPRNDSDLCTDAKMDSNHTGYLFHPTDCDKFIQCHFYPDMTVAVYRTCPPGQYWNHANLTCDKACDVDCPYEKCHKEGLQGYKMEGSCRAFWRCAGFKSVPACCPQGNTYVQGYGCVEDKSCTDYCGHVKEMEGKGVCREDREKNSVVLYSRDQSKPPAMNSREWHLKTWYHQHEDWTHDGSDCPKHGHTPPCDTDRFDLLTCRCVMGNLTYKADQCRPGLVLNFTNETMLNSIPKDLYDLRSVSLDSGFASFPGEFGSLLHLAVEDRAERPLAFSLRYRENIQVREKLELMRSTHCANEGSLSVTLNPDSVTGEIRSPDGKFANTTVSTRGFEVAGWKNLTVVYDGTSLTLSAAYRDLHYVSRVDASGGQSPPKPPNEALPMYPTRGLPLDPRL